MQMEVEKNWTELLMVMTEEDNGRVRPTEEAVLMGMPITEFFMKLLVFKERMDARVELAKSKQKRD